MIPDNGFLSSLSNLACAVATVAALMICVSAPSFAAGGGGGSGCPWQQDLSLEVGPVTLTVPQSVFDPKSLQTEIRGYTLYPNIDRLSLRILTPSGDTWEAALTRLGGKRCTAFYVGKAVLVAEAYVAPIQLGKKRVAEH